MKEYDWKQAPITLYLIDKAATQVLENPEHEGKLRSISIPGYQLGFDYNPSGENRKERKQGLSNEGLVLLSVKAKDLAKDFPAYTLEVAHFDEEPFEEFLWELLGQTSRRTAEGNFERTETFGLRQTHPYIGPIDSVLSYAFQDYDYGPRPVFEAFFHYGKLVAGWNNNTLRVRDSKHPLTTCEELVNILNGRGFSPHPSEQQVKDYLRNSNLPEVALRHFEELLGEK